MDEQKRIQNERKFEQWEPLAEGGRRYTYDVIGRRRWRARYVKEVDAEERTLRFYQEIYDAEGRLVEVHQKYPEDTGHRSPGGEIWQ